MHVETKSLPDTIQNALRRIGYGGKDIAISQSEKVSPFCGGSSGRRAFVVLLDIVSGESKTHYGSWGGSNMFNPQNVVDGDTNEYPIPPNGAVIIGSEGRQVLADLVLHPSNVLPCLPVAEVLTPDEKAALYLFASHKAFARQKEYECARWDYTTNERLPARAPYAAVVDSLVAKGMVSRNKAGATAITTKGKNHAR